MFSRYAKHGFVLLLLGVGVADASSSDTAAEAADAAPVERLAVPADVGGAPVRLTVRGQTSAADRQELTRRCLRQVRDGFSPATVFRVEPDQGQRASRLTLRVSTDATSEDAACGDETLPLPKIVAWQADGERWTGAEGDFECAHPTCTEPGVAEVELPATPGDLAVWVGDVNGHAYDYELTLERRPRR